MPVVAPFGTWRSPIGARSLVSQARGLSHVLVDADALYWTERRPEEQSRQVVVRLSGGMFTDVIDPPYNARSSVHEYGGACVAVHDGAVYFANYRDRRVYRRTPDGSCSPITEVLDGEVARFADLVVTPDGLVLFAVRERHLGDRVVNDLVAITADGDGTVRSVASGHDFYGAPRVSPDGRRLAYLAWDLPDMPWDSTYLVVAELTGDGVTGERVLAGGADESVSQPRFDATGTLHYLSDRSGFWALYDERGDVRSPLDSDFGGPDWVFGQSTYAFLADGRIAAVRFADGEQRLGIVGDHGFSPLAVPYTVAGDLQPFGDGLVALCGSPSLPIALVRVDPDSAEVAVLRSSRTVDLTGYVSVPRPISFAGDDGAIAHGLFYPPVNRDFVAPPGERPPLVVDCHGGPTAAALALLDLRIQFFTSRGFAVVTVNYGGSTGYGRAYRRRLEGNWGVVDVRDCIAAATFLADAGEVDGARMVIRGGSAGGYTALAALAFGDVFAAGASLYGVSDLATLAADTHKFESGYLERLVGPYPEAAEVYVSRSPLANVARIHAPTIFFQGLEDRVVPPSQAQAMVSALTTQGVAVAYLTFADEQHGFRQPDTIVRVAEAELAFYAEVLGFSPADEVAPVTIANREAIGRLA